MTNAEKFKTAEARREAYNKFCSRSGEVCSTCILWKKEADGNCKFRWLELEYEEELLPCPFCGGRAKFNRTLVEGRTDGWVQCTYCGAQFVTKERDEAISTWNRRVK